MSKKMFEQVQVMLQKSDNKQDFLRRVAQRMLEVEGTPPLTGRELAELLVEYLPTTEKKAADSTNKKFNNILRGQCSIWPRPQDKAKIEALMRAGLAEAGLSAQEVEQVVQEEKMHHKYAVEGSDELELLAEESYNKAKEAEILGVPLQGKTEAEIEELMALAREGRF